MTDAEDCPDCVYEDVGAGEDAYRMVRVQCDGCARRCEAITDFMAAANAERAPGPRGQA